MSRIDDYIANNAAYATNFAGRDLEATPAKQVAIVACMDARLETGALLGLEDGEAHVIRNAGGVITDDVIRSLALSQALLGTREVMLIHHTNCGLRAESDEAARTAIERATGARPDFPLGTFSEVEGSVRRSMALLAESPYLAHKDGIRGFVYDVETGRLREVEPGAAA